MQAMKHAKEYIAQWQLEEHLSPDLLRNLHLFRTDAGYEFTVQDDEAAKLYFLVEGSVHVRYAHANGKESVVGRITPLALIGELDLFYQPDLYLSLVTQEPSTFLFIDKAIALQFGQDDPRFLRLIIQNLAAKLTASTRILKHNVLPLMGQVASYLLANNAAHESIPNRAVDIPSRAYLAELMGTTPRHLNRVLNTLADEGIITLYANRIIVHDRAALIQLADS